MFMNWRDVDTIIEQIIEIHFFAESKYFVGLSGIRRFRDTMSEALREIQDLNLQLYEEEHDRAPS